MFLVHRCQGLREERGRKKEDEREKKGGGRGREEGKKRGGGEEGEGGKEKRGWFKLVRQVNRQTNMADVPNMILYGDSPCIFS